MNIPKLRFPEFNDEWQENKLNDIAKITMGQSPNSENYTNNSNDTLLIQGNADLCNGKVVPRLFTKQITKTCDKEDIIMTVRAPVGDIAISDYNACIGRGVCSIKSSKFIYHYLDYLKMKDYWKKISKGSTIDSITSDDIKFLIIKTTSKKEEEKIIKTMDLINKKIELQSKKIEDLKLFKIYLNIRLFNNNKWNKVKLSEVLEISNIRNRKNIYRKNDVLSVSDEFGVVNQMDLQGRSFAANDVSNYKIVSKGQIIYTRSPLSSKPYGIIKIVGNIEGIVSPLYIVNNVKKEFIPKFIYYLFDLPSSTNNYLRPLVRMGAKHTMNINDDEWLSGEIYVPSIDEQKKIINIFEIMNEKIEIENNKMKKMNKLKKGLMQSMFV